MADFDVVQATLSESLKNQEFVTPIVDAFVNKTKLRTNVPTYVVDLSQRYVQSNTELLRSATRENKN